MTDRPGQADKARDPGRDDFLLAVEEAPAALEALLFAAGDPLPLEKIIAITGLPRQVLENILAGLASQLEHDPRRGLILRHVEEGYFFSTKPGQKEILERLFQPRNRPPLSQAAYETLAVVAYNQPVTRAQVEAVRGVNSDSIIARLVERGFLAEAGQLDTPGRPLLYSTTEQFLLSFGLSSVKELPPMEMLMYGTLRDFETSLDAASQASRQITIDQISPAYQETEELPASVPPDPDKRPMAKEDVLAVSGALFGDDDPDRPGPE